eukprot:Awhi_evm2s11558
MKPRMNRLTKILNNQLTMRGGSAFSKCYQTKISPKINIYCDSKKLQQHCIREINAIDEDCNPNDELGGQENVTMAAELQKGKWISESRKPECCQYVFQVEEEDSFPLSSCFKSGMIRSKWMLAGATNLEEAAEQAESFGRRLREKHLEGFEITANEDSYIHYDIPLKTV